MTVLGEGSHWSVQTPYHSVKNGKNVYIALIQIAVYLSFLLVYLTGKLNFLIFSLPSVLDSLPSFPVHWCVIVREESCFTFATILGYVIEIFLLLLLLFWGCECVCVCLFWFWVLLLLFIFLLIALPISVFRCQQH